MTDYIKKVTSDFWFFFFYFIQLLFKSFQNFTIDDFDNKFEIVKRYNDKKKKTFYDVLCGLISENNYVCHVSKKAFCRLCSFILAEITIVFIIYFISMINSTSGMHVKHLDPSPERNYKYPIPILIWILILFLNSIL